MTTCSIMFLSAESGKVFGVYRNGQDDYSSSFSSLRCSIVSSSSSVRDVDLHRPRLRDAGETAELLYKMDQPFAAFADGLQGKVNVA